MGKKRVFIIHGWGGSPEGDWIPWLKAQVEKRGVFVKAPQMKGTDAPKIEEWVEHISRLVEDHHSDCYLIGHSIGCQAILRYLQTLGKGQVIAGVVLVAPWINLKGLESEGEKAIAKPWLETGINFDAAKRHMNKSVSIFSDNDKFVPLEDSEIFRNKLSSRIVIEHNKGHFTADDGVKDLSSVLNALLSFLGKK